MTHVQFFILQFYFLLNKGGRCSFRNHVFYYISNCRVLFEIIWDGNRKLSGCWKFFGLVVKKKGKSRSFVSFADVRDCWKSSDTWLNSRFWASEFGAARKFTIWVRGNGEADDGNADLLMSKTENVTIFHDLWQLASNKYSSFTVTDPITKRKIQNCSCPKRISEHWKQNMSDL